jgi:hypothetical protein
LLEEVKLFQRSFLLDNLNLLCRRVQLLSDKYIYAKPHSGVEILSCEISSNRQAYSKYNSDTAPTTDKGSQ